MARISLGRLASGYLAVDKLNSILETLETVLDRVLLRDGTAPNAMTADLDMGGNQVLNVGVADADSPSALVTYESMADYVDSKASGLVIQHIETQTATAAQTLFTLTDIEYGVGSHNLAVYVDGVRVFTPTDYEETSSTSVTFLAGMVGGEVVSFVTNEYLGSIDLAAHEHSWGQVTGKPDTAIRWPTWDEVTGKPSTFTPSTHNHAASEITSGRLADARRGIYVQSTEPTGLGVADAGVLWFW